MLLRKFALLHDQFHGLSLHENSDWRHGFTAAWQSRGAAGATHVQILWISAWIPSEVTRTFFFDLPIWDSNSSSFSCRSFSSQREPTVVGSIKLCCYMIRSTRSFSGSQQPLGWPQVNPPCVAESDQRHAQHPLKMFGMIFHVARIKQIVNRSCFWIAYIKLTCLYILIITFLSDRKSVGRNDSHIFCARPCHFSLRGWRHGSPGNHAHLHRRRHVQKCKYHTHCCPSIFATASLTTWAVAMKKRFLNSVNELSFIMVITWFMWLLMTSWVIESVDRKVAQPSPWSRVHATKRVALATWWCPLGWVKA